MVGIERLASRTISHELANRLNRRAALRGAGVATVAMLAAGAAAGKPGSRRALAGSADATSSGIGLSLDDFFALYGEGEIGQGARIYEIDGYRYASASGGVRSDIIASLYWADAQAPEPLEDVQIRFARFMPSDSTLVEVYNAPAAGIFPVVLVELYNSPALGMALEGGPYSWTGNFVIVYGYDQTLDGNIAWANIYIGQPGG